MQSSKSLFLTALFCGLFSSVFGQQTAIDSTIYASEILDIKPIYEGGEKTMFKTIANNLGFPPILRERFGTIGTAYINFVVDEKGQLDEKTIKFAMFSTGINDHDSIPKRIVNEMKLDTIQKTCVVEAKRVVSILKKWIPAQADGKPVKCRYAVPIQFKNEGFTGRTRK